MQNNQNLVKPLSYNITLDLFLETLSVFVGSSTNFLIVEHPTRKINLKVHELIIRNDIFRLMRYPYMDSYNLKTHYYSNETETLSLDFHIDLPSGFYNMRIEFSGNIFEEEMRIYKTFCKACNTKTSQFSTATPDDFWNIIQESIVEGTNDHVPLIKQLVESWLIQKSLPVVNVRRSGDSFIIRYKSMHTEEDGNSTNIMIPINYVTRVLPQDISNIVWLPRPDLIIVHKLHPLNWIVVNWQHAGYYRVKYDNACLKNLATFLDSHNGVHIDVLSRAHIIEDAYYFWSEFELDISKFRNLIRFMSNEEHCAPWYAMQNIVKKMWPFLNIDAGKPTKMSR